MATSYSVLFADGISDDSGNEYSNLLSRLNEHASETGKRRLHSNIQLASSMKSSLRNKLFGLDDIASSESIAEALSVASGSPSRSSKRTSVILAGGISANIPALPPSLKKSNIRRSINLSDVDMKDIEDPRLICKVFADKLLVVRRLEREIESCYAETRRIQSLWKSSSSNSTSSDRIVLEYLLDRWDRLMNLQVASPEAKVATVNRYVNFRADLEKRYLRALSIALLSQDKQSPTSLQNSFSPENETVGREVSSIIRRSFNPMNIVDEEKASNNLRTSLEEARDRVCRSSSPENLETEAGLHGPPYIEEERKLYFLNTLKSAFEKPSDSENFNNLEIQDHDLEILTSIEPSDCTVNALRSLRSGMKSLEKQIILGMEKLHASARAGTESKFVDVSTNSVPIYDELSNSQSSINSAKKDSAIVAISQRVIGDFNSKLTFLRDVTTQQLPS